MSVPSSHVQFVWPSAFQWAESPLHTLNEELNKNTQDIYTLGWVVAGWYVYWPVAMCATPITCMADIVAGIAEALFYSSSQSHALSIFQKKLIASPIQHLVFFGVNMSLPAIPLIPVLISLAPYRLKIMFILFDIVLYAPLMGLLLYQLTQRAVSKLPNWARPEGFNIFTNGGSLGPSGLKFTDPNYEEKCDHNFQKWKIYVETLQISLIHKLQLDEFEKFNNDLKNGLSIQECLGLTSSKPDLEETNKAYKKWALILHPDKNSRRKAIAHKLFAALQEACELLGLKSK